MRFLTVAALIGLAACSDAGPGFKNHPISCWLGDAWADCLPGTAGYAAYYGRNAPATYAPQAGKTDEDQQRDFARCKVEAVPALQTPGSARAFAATVDNCMRAQGWIRE